MKASTPEYHPKDEQVVPPPPDFPWDELKGNNIETYAFFVPFKEWKIWIPAMKEKGVLIKETLPEGLKTTKVTDIIFPEEEW